MDIILLASTRHKNPYYYVDRVKRIIHCSEINSNANSNIRVNPNVNRKVIDTNIIFIINTNTIR